MKSSPTIPEVDTKNLVHAININWQAEMEGAATYRALSNREPDEHRKRTLAGLAAAEEHHARLWEERLRELGAELPVYTGPPTGKADSFINRISGSDASLRRIEIDERRDTQRYAKQLRQFGDEKTVAVLNTVVEDEKSHSRTLRVLVNPARSRRFLEGAYRARDPQAMLEDMREKRGRRSPASWIGDAIYGVNDGLGAIFGIVSGVSGATLGDSKVVLLSGLAGMIASALSMGSGAYLAAKSEREIYEAEIARKRADLQANPEDGVLELALIMETKGLPEEDARKYAEHLGKDPDALLKMLAAEELNLTEEALSNPVVSAISGSVSTAIGAFIPIIPFFWLSGLEAVYVAAIISLIAHFAVGAAKTIITVRSMWSSGFEMTLVGAIEGIVTYVIGVGLGHIHI
jgi:predicted membrane protein (TIGR00267 family)